MATVLAKRRREFGERLRTERERLGYTELPFVASSGYYWRMTQYGVTAVGTLISGR